MRIKLFHRLLFFVLLSTHAVTGQTVSYSNIQYATCLGGSSSIDYMVNVRSAYTIVSSDLSLSAQSGFVIELDIPPSGTFTGLGPGKYRITGSIVVNRTGQTYNTVEPVDSYFWIGYEGFWTDLNDMVVQPDNYSVKRGTVTSGVTYAGARTLNTLDASSDGWIEVGPQYGSSANGSIFVPIGNTLSTGTYDPSSSSAIHLEYRKTGSTTGSIIAKVSGTSYTFFNISYTERIRIERVSGQIKFYRAGTTTQVSGSPTINYSGAWNIAAFTSGLDYGLSDAISSFACSNSSKTYAQLKYDLDGYYHVMDNGEINFVFNEEYDASTLKFTIYNSMDEELADQSFFPVISTTNGKNYITIDVTGNHCIGSGYFYLDVVNDKKEHFYLRFYNTYTNCTL